MSLYQLSQRKFPVVIAIFAILMILIAPAISKSLKREHDKQVLAENVLVNDAISSIKDHYSEGKHENIQYHACHEALDDKMNNHPVMDDSACEYCQLLIHLPIIIWAFTPFIWLIFLISHALVLPIIIGPVLLGYYNNFLPRAPPSLPDSIY